MDKNTHAFFSGHTNLSSIGEKGQQTFFDSHIILIGAGGLGTQLALLLAASGIQLTIVDDDLVSASNLIRQLAYTQKDIGQAKVDVLANAIRMRVPHSRIHKLQKKINKNLLHNLLTNNHYQLVLDATDNRHAKCAINHACIAAQQTWICANALQTNGNLIVFNPREKNAPCYTCLYPQAQQQTNACATQGVLNSLVTNIASMQAALAQRYLLELPCVPHQLTSFDILTFDILHTSVVKNPNCVDCAL